MATTTPLTDAINALTTYANGVTGASDTTLSDAVGTLAAGYGGGGSGEWTTDGIAEKTEPSGDITIGLANGKLIAERAFFKNTGITGVTITNAPWIGNYAFAECTNLRTINMPNLTKINSSNYNVASYVFQKCTSLESVAFSMNYTGGLSSYMFSGCTSLTTVDAGNASSIGNPFHNCAAMQKLILRRTSLVTFTNGPSASTVGGLYTNASTAKIYVPSSLIASYQSASNWSTLYSAGAQFLAIEGSIYE